MHGLIQQLAQTFLPISANGNDIIVVYGILVATTSLYL